jgi:putative membrane protein
MKERRLNDVIVIEAIGKEVIGRVRVGENPHGIAAESLWVGFRYANCTPKDFDMVIRRENLSLPASIIVTALAYGILGFVLFRERPTTIYSESVARLVALLPHAIAFVNALSLMLLMAGWWLIRKGYVGLHRIAMPSALGLIFVFLVMYVTRIYLGGIKEFPGPQAIYYYVYLPVLIIHLTLSISCIQPVVYVALIGLTHTVEDIPRTSHRRLGRIAVPAWILSLALGLVVYVMLNREY